MTQAKGPLTVLLIHTLTAALLLSTPGTSTGAMPATSTSRAAPHGTHAAPTRPASPVPAAASPFASNTHLKLKAPLPPQPAPSTRHAGIVSSDDMGVSYCRLFINGSAFGQQLNHPGVFMLHIFLRYTAFQGTAKVKGTATAELLEPLPPETSGSVDLQLNPHVLLLTHDRSTTLRMTGTVTFPFAPVTIAAATSPLFVKFTLPPGSTHEYIITSLGANSSCAFRPTLAPNRLDARGVEVEIVKDVAIEVKRAHVVMCPFFGMQKERGRMEAFALLLGRHIQWHAALGFQHHVVYIRGGDVALFSKLPAVGRWLDSGQLLLVLWESIPRHPHLPYYDQRIAYSHSILAFTGLHAYLAMLDLDEYVMSMRDELRTFHDMSRACNASDAHAHAPQPQQQSQRQLVSSAIPSSSASSGLLPTAAAMSASSAPARPQRPNLQITRYHSLAARHPGAASSQQGAEMEMWTAAAAAAEHPLLHYTLVNRLRPPAVKSVVRPEFIRTYNIHFASAYNAFGSTAPDPDCIFILHLKNLLANREPADPFDVNNSMRHLGFAEDLRLQRALRTRAARLSSLVAA